MSRSRMIQRLLLVTLGFSVASIFFGYAHGHNCLEWIQKGVLNAPDCANTAGANVAASVATVSGIAALGAMGLAGVGPLGGILNPVVNPDAKSVGATETTGGIGTELQMQMIAQGDNTAIMLGLLIGSVGVFLAGSGALAAVAGEIADSIAGARAAIQEWQAARAAATQLEQDTMKRLIADMAGRLNALKKYMSFGDAGLRRMPQTMEEGWSLLRAGWGQFTGADRIGVIQSLRGLYSEEKILQAMELARLERPLDEILAVLGVH